MNAFARRLITIAALAATGTIVTPVVWAAPSPETVTVSAAKVDHYLQLAAFYRERAVLGSKHQISYFTMANRCDQLAKRYRLAATAGERTG